MTVSERLMSSCPLHLLPPRLHHLLSEVSAGEHVPPPPLALRSGQVWSGGSATHSTVACCLSISVPMPSQSLTPLPVYQRETGKVNQSLTEAALKASLSLQTTNEKRDIRLNEVTQFRVSS